MKKSVSWTTPDGKNFPTRKQALAHEIHLTRVAAILRFFATALKDNPLGEADAARLAEAISRQANAFSVVISARAARSVAGLPGPKRKALASGAALPVITGNIHVRKAAEKRARAS